MVEFTVIGNPKALKRHRHFKFGTYDPSKKDKKEFYLKSINNKPKVALSGDLFLDLKFYMDRPKSHYRSGKYSDLIKDQFKNIIHTKKPDIDNLIKFVLDALSGQNGFFLDDNLIESIYAKKIYSDNPKTMILIMDKWKLRLK